MRLGLYGAKCFKYILYVTMYAYYIITKNIGSDG
jgi:hypothetical protein